MHTSKSLVYPHSQTWLQMNKDYVKNMLLLQKGSGTSLARATPVWKNRGLVTALHTTSSDGMQLADMVGRAAVAQLTKCKDGVNNY